MSRVTLTIMLCHSHLKGHVMRLKGLEEIVIRS